MSAGEHVHELRGEAPAGPGWGGWDGCDCSGCKTGTECERCACGQILCIDCGQPARELTTAEHEANGGVYPAYAHLGGAPSPRRCHAFGYEGGTSDGR